MFHLKKLLETVTPLLVRLQYTTGLLGKNGREEINYKSSK